MAAQQLATIADFETFGGKSAAFSSFTTDQKNSALLAASQEFAGYMSARYTPPFTSVGTDIKRSICAMASFDLLFSRGANPANGDALGTAEVRRVAAVKYAQDIGRGLANPPDLVDSTPAVLEGAAKYGSAFGSATADRTDTVP